MTVIHLTKNDVLCQQRQIRDLEEEAQMVLQNLDILQTTLQEKDTKIQILQQQISCQEVLIEQQATDLYTKSCLLNDIIIFVEQLIAAEGERQEHERRMRLSEREADYLQKCAEELKSIQFHPKKVFLYTKHAIVSYAFLP